LNDWTRLVHVLELGMYPKAPTSKCRCGYPLLPKQWECPECGRQYVPKIAVDRHLRWPDILLAVVFLTAAAILVWAA
jgi:hypothetical protein